MKKKTRHTAAVIKFPSNTVTIVVYVRIAPSVIKYAEERAKESTLRDTTD